MILVEGYNCSGKTTVCNFLSKELDIPIFKTFSERKLNREYDMKIENKIGLKRRIDSDLYIADFLTQVNKEIDFISDRSIFSYMFYESENKDMYNWWINKIANIKGEKRLLFCLPNYEIQKTFLIKRYGKTNENEIKKHMKKGNEFYQFIKKYWKGELALLNWYYLNLN